jgi:hypothetical protein
LSQGWLLRVLEFPFQTNAALGISFLAWASGIENISEAFTDRRQQPN